MSKIFTSDLLRNSATDVSSSECCVLEVSSVFIDVGEAASLFSGNKTVSALGKKRENKGNQSMNHHVHVFYESITGYPWVQTTSEHPFTISIIQILFTLLTKLWIPLPTDTVGWVC